MAEALALASGVAGLITLVDSVLARTFRYVRQVKDCEKTVSSLLSLLQSMSGSLHVLHQRVNIINETDTDSHCLRPQMLDECFTMLYNVKQKLSKYEKSNSQSAKEKFREGVHSLKWPFEKPSMLDLLEKLERCNDLVNSAIMADTMFAVKEIFSVASELGTEMKTVGRSLSIKLDRLELAELSKNQRGMLEYFTSKESIERHNIGMKMWHSGTCRWFTEGEKLRGWLEGEFQHLWISGRPGAGKTVLAAAIIEKTKTTVSEATEQQALAYFYCDYKDSKSQDTATIFKALIVQLACQEPKAMTMLEAYYNQYCNVNDTHLRREVPSLASLLHSIASNFDHTFIIVDALDECKETEIEVTLALSSLGVEEKISVLLLSRDEDSIHRLLRPKFEQVDLAAKNIDLEVYVHAQMERRSNEGTLVIEDIDVKDKIIDKLINGADGMFRWVACQMDYLCELSSDSEREDALQDLPPGLFATYDRILERMNMKPAATQRLVQKTLQWLIFSYVPLTTDELREALSIEEGQQRLDKRKFPNEAAILRHCGSLIRRSAYGTGLEPAHFTVVEYLSTLGDDRFKAYCVSNSLGIAKSCLTYLNLGDFADFSSIQDVEQRFRAFPFRRHAVRYWNRYAKGHLEDASVNNLIGKFMFSEEQACFWAWLHDFYQLNQRINFTRTPTDFPGVSSIHCAAFLGMPTLVERCLQTGEDVNKSSVLGAPIHCAIMGSEICNCGPEYAVLSSGSLEVLKILCRYRANGYLKYRTLNNDYMSCFEIIFISRHNDSVGIRGSIDLFSSIGVKLQRTDVVQDTTKRKLKCDPSVLRQFQISEVDESFRAEFIDILSNRCGIDSIQLESESLKSCVSLDESHARMRLYARLNLMSELKSILSFNGIDINSADHETGDTALHLAAEHEALKCAELLIIHGANVGALNKAQQRPLNKTFGNSNAKITEILLSHGAGEFYDDDDIWCQAARDDNANLLQVLKLRDEKKRFSENLVESKNPLFVAAANGANAAMLYLTSEPSLVSLLDTRGCNILHSCGQYSVSVLEKLLSVGLDVDQAGEKRRTPLHSFLTNYPAEGKTILYPKGSATHSKVLLLVRHGCNVEHVDTEGNTPLHLLMLHNLPGQYCFDFKFDKIEPMIRALATDETRSVVNSKGSTYFDCFIQEVPKVECSTAIEILSFLINDFNPLDVRHNPIEALLHRLTTKNNIHYSWVTDFSGAANIAEFLQLLVNAFPQSSHVLRGLVGLKAMIWALERRSQLLVDYLSTLNLVSEVAIPDRKAVLELILESVADQDFLPVLGKIAVNLKTFYIEVANQVTGQGALHAVCSPRNDTNPMVVDLLIDIGAQVDAKCKRGLTPLMLAARSGELQHFKRLIQFGADMHATDVNGCNALVHAVESSHVDLVDYIRTEYGAEHDWNIRVRLTPFKDSEWSPRGCSLLHAAVGSAEMITLVLKSAKFEDINISAEYGVTPLHLAVFLDNLDTIKALIDLGADINAYGAVHGTPLHMAVNHGYLETVKLLCEKGADVNKVDSRRSTPLHRAAYHGSFENAKLLLEHGANSFPNHHGLSPEALARSKKHFDLADKIHATIGERHDDKTGNTVRQPNEIHYAVLNALKSTDLDLLKLLIDLDHHKDRFTCHGCTPILLALEWEKPKFAKVLISSGYETGYQVCDESETFVGYSALHLASRDAIYIDILRILLSQSDQYHHYPVHPLHIAAANNNAQGLKILLSHYNQQAEFDINTIKIINDELNHAWTLSKFHTTIDQNCRGSILHVAALSCNAEIVKILLENNADVNLATNPEMMTPLHIAASTWNTDVVQFLITNGANVNARTRSGETPLMRAMVKGYVQIGRQLDTVEVLLKNGAEAMWHDLQRTAWRGLCNNSEILGLLTTYGVWIEHSVGFPRMVDPIFVGSMGSFLLNTDNVLEELTSWTLAEAIRIESSGIVTCLLKWLSFRGLLADALHSRPSPLCMAVQSGNGHLLQKLLRYKPDINCQGCDEGTALDVACKLERLDIIRLLVRNGAEYTTSCVQNPKIRNWLLLGRWTDQKRICSCEATVQEVKPWSGLQEVPIPIVGQYKQNGKESLLDWFVRRKRMQEWFFGKVLHHGPGIERPFATRYL